MLKASIVIWCKMENRMVEITNRLFLTFFDRMGNIRSYFEIDAIAKKVEQKSTPKSSY